MSNVPRGRWRRTRRYGLYRTWIQVHGSGPFPYRLLQAGTLIARIVDGQRAKARDIERSVWLVRYSRAGDCLDPQPWRQVGWAVLSDGGMVNNRGGA